MLRAYKRFIIIALTLLVLGLPALVFVVPNLLKPEPTCFDNVQNQDEEGIDCGGGCPLPCEIAKKDEIEVVGSFVVPIGQNIYDIVVEIKNPSANLGVSVLDYDIKVYGIGGEEVKRLRDKDFLLPRETAFVITPGASFDRVPGSIEVIFDETTWVAPRVQDVGLEVASSTYRTLSQGSFFASEATGVVKNNSPFGFDAVVVSVLLFDDRGNILATATSEINTLKSKEARFFKVTWPESFSRPVREVRMIPRTNTMNEQNILRPPPGENIQ